MKIYYFFLSALFILTSFALILTLIPKFTKLTKIRLKLPKPILIIFAILLAGYGVYYIFLALSY
jgi:hypothetical protein